MSVLFVWIPRTGGSSLSAAFEATDFSYQRIIDADKYQNWLDITTFQHWPIKTVLHEIEVDLTYIEHCWSFSVVRNTWDRLVSLYAKIKELGWITYSFEEFIQLITTTEFPTQLQRPHVNAAKRGKYQDYYTLKARSMVARRYKEEIAIFDYKF